jgi:hypothetical protein
VGTSEVKVHCSSASVLSRCSGSKLLRSYTQFAAPQYANANAKKSEFAWHIGMTRSAVFCREKPSSAWETRDSSAVASWLRIAPLGLPVVPDVYMSASGSSERIWTVGSLADAAAMIPS